MALRGSAAYAAPMPSLFHVSSVRNRASIAEHGLDWTRMAAASGIAGSNRPEEEGAFLCRDEFEADFFVRLNNTGGPVDVWIVDEIDEALLSDNRNGFLYLPDEAPAGRSTDPLRPPTALSKMPRR
jgi:hypothetical protein